MPFADEDGVGEPRIQLEQVGDDGFDLLRGFRYTVPRSTRTYVVKIHQPTDLASVPFFLTWLIRSYGRYTLAAILHDYLWRERHDVPLREANRVFRLGMYDLKVPFIRRWIMWAAVSLAALSRTNRLWKARAGLWIASVLGLDVVTLWMLGHGVSARTLPVIAICFVAALMLLLPRLEIALMGLPTLYLLAPAIAIVLLTTGVYLILDFVVSGLHRIMATNDLIRQKVERLAGRPIEKPNPVLIRRGRLQRSS
jgi:Protein of unknown function (DUF1353)